MSHRCYHCQEAIPAGIRIHGEFDGHTQAFCCHACLGVAELIHQGGLDRYYTTRTQSAPRPEPRFASEHWLAYDLPAVAQQYVYTDDNGEHEIHLFIDGIHCAACHYLIKGTLKNRLNIEHAFINATTGRAEIRFGAQKLSDILATIASLGYTPNLFTPDSGETQLHRERNRQLLRLIVAGLGTMQLMMFAYGFYTSAESIDAGFAGYLRYLSLAITTPVLFYSGLPFLKSAWFALKARRVNMDVPVAFALLGTYLASAWHTVRDEGEIYFETVGMFIFFLLISRFLEFLTRRRARLNEYRFARLLPEAVTRIDGEHSTLIPLPTVQVGDILRILPTHTIAADGDIIRGETRVNEAMLSGESTPVYKRAGDKVLAGSSNLQSPIDIRVTQTGQQTTLAGIRRIVHRAEQNRAAQIDRNETLAQWTIISVLLLALGGYGIWLFIDAARAFDIAVAVLVATCPCALSLATPAALTTAVNRAHQAGILIKSTDTLERLPAIRHILFDKTGTLTQGRFQLQQADIYADPAIVWQIAKSLEAHSSHPIAWYFSRQEVPTLPLSDIVQESGRGVSGNHNGKRYHIGSAAFVHSHVPHLALPPAADGNNVYLADTQTLLAHFHFSDPLRSGLADTLNALRPYTLHILSGDRTENVAHVAHTLHIEHAHGGLSAEEKLHYLQTLDTPTLMIGDGINDAPVMAGADVSVAVGRANPLSQTHADIVCLEHGPEALPFLFTLAARTQRLIRQNLLWASAYNAIVLPLAVCGFLTPWIAALGMSASSVIVVANALRIARQPLPEKPAPQ